MRGRQMVVAEGELADMIKCCQAELCIPIRVDQWLKLLRRMTSLLSAMVSVRQGPVNPGLQSALNL
ncbi:MAG: hypothetical protein AAGA32_03050 [Pseudomonadota bacterium]